MFPRRIDRIPIVVLRRLGNEENRDHGCWEGYQCSQPKDPRPIHKLGKCSTNAEPQSCDMLIGGYYA